MNDRTFARQDGNDGNDGNDGKSGGSWGLWLAALAVWPVIGCHAGAPSQPAEVEVRRAALSVGTNVLLQFPAGASTDVPVAALGGALTIGDRAQLKETTGAFAGATQVGAALVDVGASARIGSLTTQGAITLRSQAQVNGNVIGASTITPQNGVVVTGTETPGATVTPFATESWQVPVADAPNKPTNVAPGLTLALAPGSYGDVSIQSRSTLKLKSGIYGLTSLDIEPQAILQIDDSNGPVALYLQNGFIFRGSVTTVSGGPPSLLVVQMGTPTCTLDATFHGTVVAPNATLELGPGQQPHEGSFYAKSILIDPGTIITHRSFFRLQAAQRWSVAAAGFDGPFGAGGLDATGAVLAAGRQSVLAISPQGVASTVLSRPQPSRFAIEPLGARFAEALPGSFTIYNRAGTVLATLPRPDNGFARLLPATTLTFVPDMLSGGAADGVVTNARFFDGATLRSSFPAQGLSVSRVTATHIIYTAGGALHRATIDGVETWQRNLQLATFEISSNGQTLIGVMSTRGSVQIVHVDLPSGTVGTPIPLDGAFWNIAAAPSGQLTVATTRTAIYVFSGGQLARRIETPASWLVSADISDQGYVVAGAQLATHAAELLLLGSAGAGISTVSRPPASEASRPFVRFFPSGQEILVNELGGLTTFDLSRAP